MATEERSREARIIGETIRAERAAKGVTQKGLADALGIHQQVLMRYEQGKRDIPGALMIRIAAALGMSFSTLARRLQDRLDESE